MKVVSVPASLDEHTFDQMLAAIRAGKDIAVASKEILVMAGEIVMNRIRR